MTFRERIDQLLVQLIGKDFDVSLVALVRMLADEIDSLRQCCDTPCMTQEEIEATQRKAVEALQEWRRSVEKEALERKGDNKALRIYERRIAGLPQDE